MLGYGTWIGILFYWFVGENKVFLVLFLVLSFHFFLIFNSPQEKPKLSKQRYWFFFFWFPEELFPEELFPEELFPEELFPEELFPEELFPEELFPEELWRWEIL
jgi:hypothetical protein